MELQDLMAEDGELCLFKIITEIHPECKRDYLCDEKCNGYRGCDAYIPQGDVYRGDERR
jgi:hypothetical protein